ncbi:HAMP domain-containing sensor histidine kinase [Hyphomonas sp. NPDC076900]|uniref:HAMP domain-containing sensor histidine kinase n=1 Tax=unclassified Hyphomonas TaxID=2630699 RepID=UPI003D059842
MKRLFADTLLTRSILIVVAALIVAQLIAIVTFKLIAENVFIAMQRAAQVEVATDILVLASQQPDEAAFVEAVSGHANVLFVRSEDRAMGGREDEIGQEVRRHWLASGQGAGKVTAFRISGGHDGPPTRFPRLDPGERPARGPGMGEGGLPPSRTPEAGPIPRADAGQEPEGRPPNAPQNAPINGGPGPGYRAPMGFDRVEGRIGFPSRLLNISVEYEPGNWVNVLATSGADRGPPIQPFIFVLSMSLLAVAIAAGLAAGWIYRPLEDLARASKALGRGEKHMPLPVSGPRDLRNVMQAFNTMATRLEATLQSQKDVLVAIGHDLRTPLTAMRIRAAMIEDEAEREKMERALDELQSLTEAALQAGTSSLRTDEKLMTDLGALVESLSEDLRDIGQPVTFSEPDQRFVVRAWPEDLTRALRNIIMNAVRYGERARVHLEDRGSECAVIIDDDGPGIPEAQMEAVFEPLVRLEKSRNTATGGHGLGLHISRNIILAHGGHIELANRPEGGCRATVTLPFSMS